MSTFEILVSKEEELDCLLLSLDPRLMAFYIPQSDDLKALALVVDALNIEALKKLDKDYISTSFINKICTQYSLLIGQRNIYAQNMPAERMVFLNTAIQEYTRIIALVDKYILQA